jgi:peptide/nickel transport system permease protein
MRDAAGFVLRRVLTLIATLLLSSFVVFGALYLAPGSPLALLTGGRGLPPATVAQLSAQYNLDRPFFERYWLWLTDILHGDFGRSVVFRAPVTTLIGPRIGTTLMLICGATILIVIFGVALGLAASLRKGATDTTIIAITSVGLATPVFVTATFLLLVFGVSLRWFPTVGAGEGFGDRIYHLAMPSAALAVAGAAYVARLTRSSVNAELGSEHVETARSRGIPERLVIRRHVVRNGLIPITTVVGVTVASLIAGAVVVERAFGVDGLGSFLLDSVTKKDFASVQAITLILVALFVVVNTAVDVLSVILDPRMALR